MMYPIAGHTMGTPEYTVCEAIELLHKMGADGVEIVVQDDYKSGLPTHCSREILEQVKQCAQDNHIQIICLTPYNSYFNSLDEEVRQKELAAIEDVIGYCDFLGAKYIRIYGGNLVAEDTEKLEERWAKLVESLQYLGDKVAAKGVTLVVENHFNTMAVSAKQSAKLMEDVNHPAVRILYDQANLAFTGNEDYVQAIQTQQQYVAYMHVKDLVFKEGVAFTSSDVAHPKEEERNVYTRIVGEGVLPWPEILRAVKERGYDGWLSLEYERRWHPDDIPDASIGMKQSLDYLRSISL